MNEARNGDHEEKETILRSTNKLLDRMLHQIRALRICREFDMQGKRVPSLPDDLAAWAGIVSSSSFEETVRFWGFDSVEQLFSMSENDRIEYYDQAISFIECIFGPKAEGLERILDAGLNLVDKGELRILQLRAEDIEREVMTAFVGIASRCGSSSINRLRP